MGCAVALAQAKPEPVNCIIYMQYDPDLGSEERKTAFNKDIKASAKALAEKTGGLLSEVNKKNTFAGVFQGIIKEKKCCKKIDIVGHGNPDGSLQLPYDNPGAQKLSYDDKKNAGANTLGGPKAKTAQGSKWLAHFVATIKGQKGKKKSDVIPPVLCPDPEKGVVEDKPTVTFNTCWAGKADDGIAEQVAKEGVQTEGWTGSCKFPVDEKTGKGEPPRAGTGEEESGSKLEKFERNEAKSQSMVIPGRPGESYAVTGTDGEAWCTYGDGVGIETTLIITDESGTPIEIATAEETPPPSEGTPVEPKTPTPPEVAITPTEPTPETPTVAKKVPEQPPSTPTETVPEQPPSTPETPPTTENVPEQPPTTPETPETPEVTEQVPEEPTSPIPDTIFVKAKEAVLEGTTTGAPIENQLVKLFPAEEPDLPGTGETKEAEDTGFDKDPVECTTGAEGDCKMQIPVEDRPTYDLPPDGKPGRTYRVDYDLPKDSGGVAETTGKPAKPDVKSGTPVGADIAYEEFSIGERTFIRLVYEQAHGLDHDFGEQFKPVFGESYEEDYCRDKQPGPPLGMQPPSFSALNHDLPEAAIRFGATVPAHGDAP